MGKPVLQVDAEMVAWLRQNAKLNPNLVSISSTGKVLLKEDAKRMLDSGQYVYQALLLFGRSLDIFKKGEAVEQLHSDSSLQPQTRLYNWNVITRLLTAFGYTMDGDTKSLIVSGDDEVLGQFVSDLQAFLTQKQRAKKAKPEAKPEPKDDPKEEAKPDPSPVPAAKAAPPTDGVAPGAKAAKTDKPHDRAPSAEPFALAKGKPETTTTAGVDVDTKDNPPRPVAAKADAQPKPDEVPAAKPDAPGRDRSDKPDISRIVAPGKGGAETSPDGPAEPPKAIAQKKAEPKAAARPDPKSDGKPADPQTESKPRARVLNTKPEAKPDPTEDSKEEVKPESRSEADGSPEKPPSDLSGSPDAKPNAVPATDGVAPGAKAAKNDKPRDSAPSTKVISKPVALAKGKPDTTPTALVDVDTKDNQPKPAKVGTQAKPDEVLAAKPDAPGRVRSDKPDTSRIVAPGKGGAETSPDGPAEPPKATAQNINALQRKTDEAKQGPKAAARPDPKSDGKSVDSQPESKPRARVLVRERRTKSLARQGYGVGTQSEPSIAPGQIRERRTRSLARQGYGGETQSAPSITPAQAPISARDSDGKSNCFSAGTIDYMVCYRLHLERMKEEEEFKSKVETQKEWEKRKLREMRQEENRKTLEEYWARKREDEAKLQEEKRLAELNKKLEEEERKQREAKKREREKRRVEEFKKKLEEERKQKLEEQAQKEREEVEERRRQIAEWQRRKQLGIPAVMINVPIEMFPDDEQ